MYNYAKFAAAAGLVAVANGHMVMKSPQPFTFTTDSSSESNAGQTNSAVNRPLSATGSDFPCRYVAGSWDGPVNSFALGSSQTLSLTGSAVHGGGSCQLSITYDTEPTKSSVWKVIHTVQGGCPARNTAGNLGDDASLSDPFTYDYTIPDNIPTGNATIAWSWINRIGNREFYMNCGALSLTGTSGDQSNYDALPDLFVANIPTVSTCSSEMNDSDDKDITIPNPGDSVETNVDSTVSTTTYDPATCPAASSTSGGSAATTTKASSAAATTTAKASASAGSSSGAGAGGGVFITQTTAGSAATTAKASSAAAATTTAKASTAAAAAATSKASTAAAAASSSTSSGTTTGVKSGTCSPDGTYYCTGSSFQQCASGTWSVALSMAAGTSCTPGESNNLAILADRKLAIRGRRV